MTSVYGFVSKSNVLSLGLRFKYGFVLRDDNGGADDDDEEDVQLCVKRFSFQNQSILIWEKYLSICFLDGLIRPREVQRRAAFGLFLVYPGEQMY